MTSKQQKDFLKRAEKQLSDSFDDEYGGFGSRIKFPSPQNLLFLCRYAYVSDDRSARLMAEKALRGIYKGGLHDHFGGGFYRGPADREWLAPVFEKNLCDNALLALAYTEAWQSGHMEMYKNCACGALDFCLSRLKTCDGGFCFALREKPGVEPGMSCTFTPDEINSVLGSEAGPHFCACYDITEEGNFRGRSIPNLLINTRWHLVPEGYGEYMEKLAVYRDGRDCLTRDSRILLSANGMLLSALSRASRTYGSRYYTEALSLAAYLKRQIDESGEDTLATADLAYCGLGFLELYAADYNTDCLEMACRLASVICQRIAASDSDFDLSSGGKLYDGEAPSPVSVSAVLLEKLGRITGVRKYAAAAECVEELIISRSGPYPAGCTFGLCAVLSSSSPSAKTVLCVSETPDVPELLDTISSVYMPDTDILFLSPANAEYLIKLAPWVEGLSPGIYMRVPSGQIITAGV